MRTISRGELNDKMRKFIKELLRYDNLSISFDENCLCIGVVHYEVYEGGEKENKNEKEN